MIYNHKMHYLNFLIKKNQNVINLLMIYILYLGHNNHKNFVNFVIVILKDINNSVFSYYGL